MRGRVLFFDKRRGFGFIEPDDGGENVFVHVSALSGAVDRIADHDLVLFERVPSRRLVNKLQAADVRVMADLN